MTADRKIKRALLSVSNKSNIIGFAKSLEKFGVELVSTGGTCKMLHEAGLNVLEVSDVTGFPEMMDGRVKTLHPAIHGGLLAKREDPAHRQAMSDHDIGEIDLLVINLYPFEQTLEKGGKPDQLIENIDIGGPAMIRSAAKNHADVTVIVDTHDYGGIVTALEENDGAVPFALRQSFAAKAFARTASYDAAIATWFQNHTSQAYGEFTATGGSKLFDLRYGENPHQNAAFYKSGISQPGVATAKQVQGKQLSYNNINDTDAAFELISEFQDEPAVAIIKHANPCGVALASTLSEAYTNAFAGDPVSAFGGIVATNTAIDAEAATKITEIFTEVIIAPGADEAALEIFAKKPNLRLLLTGSMPSTAGDNRQKTVRSVTGGLLVQDKDIGHITKVDLKTVTERAPTETELSDLLFAFRICKHIKSNAILFAKNKTTLGIGAGQMSRVDSTRIAARKASERKDEAVPSIIGSVAASDAFFPFADGLETLIEAGATAIIQPGGSMRDDDVIAAANKAGIAMVFTGMRHFRH